MTDHADRLERIRQRLTGAWTLGASIDREDTDMTNIANLDDRRRDLERKRKAQEHYFGGCPECGDTDGYLNVSRTHWFVCDEHRTRWCAGAGLFSSHQDETEADWQANSEKLDGYREVDPLCVDPNLDLGPSAA